MVLVQRLCREKDINRRGIQLPRQLEGQLSFDSGFGWMVELVS